MLRLPVHAAGAIRKATMREFDAICPLPVREFSASDIKHLRQSLKLSQPAGVRPSPAHHALDGAQVGVGRHQAGRPGAQALERHRRQRAAGYPLMRVERRPVLTPALRRRLPENHGRAGRAAIPPARWPTPSHKRLRARVMVTYQCRKHAAVRFRSCSCRTWWRCHVRSYRSLVIPGPSAAIPRIRYSCTDVAPSFKDPPKTGQACSHSRGATRRYCNAISPRCQRSTVGQLQAMTHVPRSFRAVTSDGLTALDPSDLQGLA
jgi:putative transcriptional regulator